MEGVTFLNDDSVFLKMTKAEALQLYRFIDRIRNLPHAVGESIGMLTTIQNTLSRGIVQIHIREESGS